MTWSEFQSGFPARPIGNTTEPIRATIDMPPIALDRLAGSSPAGPIQAVLVPAPAFLGVREFKLFVEGGLGWT